MQLLKQIFEVRNLNNKHKQITIFGIKIKIKRMIYSKQLMENILQNEDNIYKFVKTVVKEENRLQQTNISTAFLHQKTFLPFKNIYAEREIVIVASGPSAKYYTKPVKDAIHIAVNRSFLLENVNFDYIFIQDYSGPTKSYIEDLINYQPQSCAKFFGLTCEYGDMKRVIPESLACRANALRYRTDWAPVRFFEPKFAYDISTQPLGCFGSIVFPALQFALWTNPKTIYLVGCDCTNDGYFNSANRSTEFQPDNIYLAYEKFKHFVKIYYPETKIVSVNPVRLKGLFDNDLYTENMQNSYYKQQ